MDVNAGESREPSYYEIALTNRQVVVAFVVLLVCLLAAFFSGVWIGRGAAAGEARQVAANAPTAPAEGTALEEFEFFEQPADGTDAAPVQPDTTTLSEDLGAEAATAPEPEAAPAPREEEPERRRRERRAAAEPTPETPEEADAPEPTPARDRPPSEIRPAPARPVSAAPTAPTPATASGAPAAGSVVIQVFSSAEQDQAVGVRDRLAKGGFSAFLSPVEVANRTMYRVRLGPFPSREAADEVAARVRQQHKLDTWVTTE